MEDLTPRQKELLEYLVTFVDQNGYPPSFREIAGALGFKSTNGVAYQLKALEELGYLERQSSGTPARALRLSSRATGHYRSESTVSVPILGRVAAGKPLLSDELFEGTFFVDASLCPKGATVFALQVRGQSMVEDGILDGDMVLVKKQETARNNDVVVAILDGDATVKRLRMAGGEVELVPANSSMKPIPVSKERDFRIAGVVVGLFRNLG